ncbi:hypothetical protein FRC11_004922 [Ceratobasidium sp. 423]|nr:hypothetical protein FRC11_004922 [Ceratobasidium sp. 423]
MDPSTSASELDVPIGLAVDFADELEFELGLSSVQDKPVVMSSPRLSSIQMSPSPSQISTGGNMTLAPNSPASTAYMTSPPTSPTPMSFPPDTRPDSDSESEQDGMIRSPLNLGKGKSPIAPSSYDIKGKSRAIPTPKLALRELSPREFQTPPDTSFGAPSGSGLGPTAREGSRMSNTTSPTDVSTRDLPSIMPLGPSSDSSEPEVDVTPRPSRIRSRALSGLSFSSLRDAVNSRRRGISRQPSISASGTTSPTSGLGRKLSLKGIASLVRRKKDRDGSMSRSGLSSEVTSGISTPASAFLTPSSTIVRRNGGGPTRVSVVGPWESESSEPSGSSGDDSSTPQQDDTPPANPIPKLEQEVVPRPVRGRAETAPTGDYFGFTFGFEDDEEDKEKPESDEPSREDSSDVLVQASDATNVEPPSPESPFDRLPRELHLLILGHLARSYIDDHVQAIQDGIWSTAKAGSTENKWVGEAGGLRAIVGVARVSSFFWGFRELKFDRARFILFYLFPGARCLEAGIHLPTTAHFGPESTMHQFFLLE